MKKSGRLLQMAGFALLMGLASGVYAQPSSTATYLPQIADGGGYSTTITILNVTGSLVAGTLKFFNSDGSPLALQINGQTASQFNVSVPANGSVRLRTSNSGSKVTVGWADVEGPTRLQAFDTYDLRLGNALFATAGILGTAGATRVVVPIEINGNNETAGVAITNPQSASIGVRLRLYDESGNEISNVLDPRLNPIPSEAHVSDFVSGYFKNMSDPFKGSLGIEVIGSGVVGVTGISIKEGLLSAIPVIEAAATSTGTGNTGTVVVERVSTTDSSGNAKSSFAPGDTVKLTIAVNNTTGSDATAPRTYSLTDPQGNVLFNDTATNGTIPAGRWSFAQTTTLSSSAPSGTYTFQGTVTYAGTPSSKSTTFTVAGTTSGTSSQTQAQKLLGTWRLTFTISALAGSQTNIYHLTVIQQDSTGLYYAVDYSPQGHYGAYGFYDDTNKTFALVDSADTGNPQSLIFTFNFTGNDSVSGCLYAFDKGSTNYGACHSMSGVRTAN
jgi:hypothetical protein